MTLKNIENSNSKTIDLSIILCTYNEVERIEKAYNNIIEELKNSKINFELLIVDNNSNDGTKEKILKFKNDYTKIILHKSNYGKGASIKSGIINSFGNYILIFDPDLEYSTRDILPLYNHIDKNKLDFVIGSRRLNKKISYRDIFALKNKSLTYIVNYIGVFFLTSIINFLYNQKLTDTASALKIFENHFIKKIKLKRNGFNLDFELVCRSAKVNGKIDEVQVDYYPRSKAEGKKIKAIKDGSSSLVAIFYDRFF